MGSDSNRGRDLRDPHKLGSMLRTLTRVQGVPVLKAADELPSLFVPDYRSEVMSADPELHHSKTPQFINHQEGSED